MKLENLYAKMKELLYFEDTKLIDLVLGIMLSREQKHAKLWTIIIGRSSEGKSELLKLFDDGNRARVVRTFTSRTLVNGYKDKDKFPDLAPALKDKVLLIPEMACILTAHAEERNAIWAQLRDLYDGISGRETANGKNDYKNLNVSFIGCSTPTIDKHSLLKDALGTRELNYRCEKEDDYNLMDKIVKNSTINKGEIREEIKVVVDEFLKERKYNEIELSDTIKNKLYKWAMTLSNLRVSPDVNYSSGELNSFCEPEAPSRVLEQLIVMYRALKSLDTDYTDEKAMSIIKKVVLSSCDPIRYRVLELMVKMQGTDQTQMSKREVGYNLEIDPKHAYWELNILTQLKLLKRVVTSIDESRDLSYCKWSANTENDVIKHITEELK